jgi:putative transposase
MLQDSAISERRACALVGLARDIWRHPARRAEADRDMSQRITKLAHERRRFVHRRIADLLRGAEVNDKRVYWLYRLGDLAVRKRRGSKRLKLERVPLNRCEAINEVWSMDCVSDSLANGRRIKPDDPRRLQPRVRGDRGGPRHRREYVAWVLDQAARFRGYPRAVRTDQGPEFTSRAFLARAMTRGVRHILNQLDKPTQNA